MVPRRGQLWDLVRVVWWLWRWLPAHGPVMPVSRLERIPLMREVVRDLLISGRDRRHVSVLIVTAVLKISNVNDRSRVTMEPLVEGERMVAEDAVAANRGLQLGGPVSVVVQVLHVVVVEVPGTRLGLVQRADDAEEENLFHRLESFQGEILNSFLN